MAGLTVRAGALWNRGAAQEGGLALIVSVTKADGTRVTGLTDRDFAVYVFDRFSSAPPPAVKAAPPFDFGEVSDPAGVYGMVTPSPPAGGWSDEELVIVVDVEAGADQGRTLINPIITKP
jgi:hypothetical protein